MGKEAIQCPKCGKMTLRIVNVMATTERIHYACGNCCHKEQRPYNWDQQEGKHEKQTRLGE